MSLMDEFKKIIHPYDDEDYDYEEEQQFPTQRPGKDSYFDDRKEDRRGDDRRNKVVNIHATTQLKVVLVKPERFDNVSEIADHLRDKHSVLLNLENTDRNIARRLVDFLSGCAYAVDGKIKKVAASAYLLTPYNVEIVGDLVEELENNGVYF